MTDDFGKWPDHSGQSPTDRLDGYSGDANIHLLDPGPPPSRVIDVFTPPPDPERHKTRGGYGPHEWDCVPCSTAAVDRARRRVENNPHRKGTKAWNKWDREAAALGWAMDMRGETYWSM